MKKVLLMALAFGSIQLAFAQTVAKKLDTLVGAYAQVHKFNGAVLVAKNGRILLEKGYGEKNFSAHSLNNANTIFQIASITKQFTSTVILKLVELNKMTLTDSLSKFYPDFPEGNKVTIYNLLTHTAGIPNYTLDSAFMKDVVNKNSKPLNTVDALIKYNKLDFPPGTNWNYSNQGYQLLGEIIQKLTKMSYYKAVRKYIFTPLHMNHSGFDFAHLNSKDKATGYYTYPEKDKNEEAPIINDAFSAGAIYSTVGDLYKWHRGLQAYKIVSKASMDKAYTPFKNHYGFGWFIDTLFGKRVISHSGDIWGFKTNIARVTEDDVCIVLLNNIEDEEMRGQFTNDLLAALYGQPYTVPVKRQEIQVNEDVLKRYAGTYEITPQFSMEIVVENRQLWVLLPGQPKMQLFAQKENFFFSKDVEGQVEFVTDETGKVDKLLLYQGGHQIPGKKIK
jgi:CubicO group peptidase (beta-lactamase class C family)